MSIKEISSKKLFKEYQILIPFEEINNSINLKIEEIIPTVSLPGFRKGKAPLSIVRKKYENNVLSEVIEKIIEEKTKSLLDEKKLKAYRQPKVEVKKYEKNEPVEISIKIDLEPKVEITPFDDFEISNKSIKLEQKVIDENYKKFLESQKHYHKVSKLRPVELGDKIIVNITTADESVPSFLKDQKNLSIVTDSDYQILPDISNKLIEKKAKAGDKIEISFDLKEVLNEKNKKETKFLIEIISLEHPHNFKVTKEFLEKNNLKDEDHLKENLKKNLQEQYNGFLKQIQKKELMDTLDSKNSFDVPEGILEEEFNLIWQRLEQAKKDNKLDDDDKNLSDSDLKKQYKKIALRRVKLAILMQQIAKKQEITVTEKELTDGMLNYASQYPGQEKQIFEYFKSNPSSVESIRGPIYEQKIIDFILTKIKLKDEQVNMKQFEKLQKESFKGKEIQ